jgi:hypothetical protein
MKISVITITCRQNPRLDVVGRTLDASLARVKDVSLHWIIVDEYERSLEKLGIARFDDPDRDFTISVHRPLPSEARAAIERLPAHNSARNAGLIEIEFVRGLEQYVVFLNDCNVVTIDWVAVVRDCAKQGVGWKCKTHTLHDMAIPEDGVVRMRDHSDRLRPVPPTTVAGPCWGAPLTALWAIKGFDVAYDGQHKGGDIDAITRLARSGLTFISTERAFTVQLKRTKIASEITTSKEAHAGARNQLLLNELARDKARIFPSGPGLAPPPSAPPREPVVVQESPLASGVIRRTGAARSATPPPARAPRAVDNAPPVKASATNGAGDASTVDEEKLLDDLSDLA